MFGRLKKLFRFYWGRGEFNLTKHERYVLSLLNRMLRNCNPGLTSGVTTFRANDAFFDFVMKMPSRPDTLTESNLSWVMKELAAKLLKQTNWE